MKVDYIIVGLGLAGLAFAEELERNKKSFTVYEDESQNSSRVAGGVYNPVILKRFTPVWDAFNQLEIAIPFYKSLEKKLNIQIDHPLDIYRIFTSVEEQNNWFNACDKPFFTDYMIPKVIKNTTQKINAPYGLGKITNTGKVGTEVLLEAYKNYLIEKNQLINERFDYFEINFMDNSVSYKNITAKKIIFCEGYGVVKNPYFATVPLKEAKGELLNIHSPNLKIDFTIKSSVFIMPLGDDTYKVGATFNWEDKTTNPTREAREELENKLQKIITVPYKVINQKAGIRPTVKDRRPIIGKHPNHPQLAILNGLGTRGVMLAPKMAKQLYNHLENNQELLKEVDISRFKN
ncbi:FAD-dependent oxidoreductase [Aureibaculum sp. 2210JD6-5]|uniref:NAD(P)/FAD-dependent oxidoreductase n=1 Tax=Aureibaculum sp. 2210JD6-5 TaxID=3103957 RepID=UPI002AACA31A|nr:FAD-dependent oxidoreductase [Aureibaculum sp. 2210JD6-5]MDY7395352.1 FAD-dependent oxidoreductase [Aureibaculum sp. 2210JD6-5]